MPEIPQIDWSSMPVVPATRGQLSKNARRKLAKKKRSERLKTQGNPRNGLVTIKPSFEPVLPNRDRYKLQHELSIINSQIRELKDRQRQIVKDMKEIDRRKKYHQLTPVSLYALELEDGCYYVGMSFDVERRFKKHGTGKGAAWTRVHKPISIIEVRETTFYDQDEVAKLEDDMTLEYALKYGSDKVRGGGYCQAKPHWPAVIIENEIIKI